MVKHGNHGFLGQKFQIHPVKRYKFYVVGKKLIVVGKKEEKEGFFKALTNSPRHSTALGQKRGG